MGHEIHRLPNTAQSGDKDATIQNKTNQQSSIEIKLHFYSSVSSTKCIRFYILITPFEKKIDLFF